MKFTSYMLVVLAAVLTFVIFNIMVAMVEKSRRVSNPANSDKMKRLHIALANLQIEIDTIQHRDVQQNAVANLGPASGASKPKPIPHHILAKEGAGEHNMGHEFVNRVIHKALKRAVIFTMDSIGSYEKNSLSGGAAGEITVRKSLQYALKHFGVQVDVIESDAHFNACNLKLYDFVILDPWTWAAKGWVPKPNIAGSEDRVYILDFFGSKGLRKTLAGKDSLNVPPERFLTAFGSADNTFLGYFMENSSVALAVGKRKQGVVWGKDSKHFAGKDMLIKAVANDVSLVSTATVPVFAHKNIDWRGHQSAAEWLAILQQSRFMIGLGNPILGPSAIDAVSMGCMFLNPVFDQPVMHNGLPFASQHPFAEKLGAPYVCNYRQTEILSLKQCVQAAMKTTLPARIPTEFTLDAHLQRVKGIFDL